MAEFDQDETLVPVVRDRCYTWPLSVVPEEANDELGAASSSGTASEESVNGNGVLPPPPPASATSSSSAKKKSSKKKNPALAVATKKLNPWGEESYADLITRALQSDPGGRMKLCDIYQWFSDNIPYFAGRTSQESSSGWKVRSRCFPPSLSLSSSLPPPPYSGPCCGLWNCIYCFLKGSRLCCHVRNGNE